MKKGHYVYVEFYVDDNDEDSSVEKIRLILDNQPYEWELGDVEYEEGDDNGILELIHG